MAFCPRCKREMGQTATVCPHCGHDFPETQPTPWPLWVRVGMMHLFWTSRTRATAMSMFGLVLALDIACAIAGLWERNFFWGVLPTSVGALWCWLAVRWVDRHGGWPEAA